ncbi:ribbon-helix-helix domain-containing protein [Phytoactinopolyspora halophila]|nr:ribbon-helix-helix protein, CopG family [Phytoactinopolyspora halophila]
MTRKPKIDDTTTIRDINLDQEEVHFQGERLTEQRAEQVAEETLAKLRNKNLIPGGKSLSGGGKHSPTVQFRVPEELREEVERRAAAEGVSVSKFARHALEEYLKAS